MTTFADRVIAFNRGLDFTGTLPEGINIMNPFRENEYILQISSAFYKKFYDDNKPRRLILGINPGRFGAGFTGIPFTDTKRLTAECGLDYTGRQTYELSSVFIYEVINKYGGPEAFYNDLYINSVCPLGFTMNTPNGKEINFNYYDRKDLTDSVSEFITENIRTQIDMGIETDICFCLGKGKNDKFLQSLNEKHSFFKKIIALEHPRWIMQYRSGMRHEYAGKYVDVLRTGKG